MFRNELFETRRRRKIVIQERSFFSLSLSLSLVFELTNSQHRDSDRVIKAIRITRGGWYWQMRRVRSARNKKFRGKSSAGAWWGAEY